MAEAPFTSAPGENWCACHTKPRCEKKFAGLMSAEHFVHYLPLVPSVRRYQNQTKRFTKPLFPSYVFVRMAPEKRARVYQQDLLVRVLPVEDEPRFLRQMEDVRIIATSGLELSLRPLLQRGTRARVVGGPLHGLIGVVDDPANPQGIVLAVDVLQQGLLVKLPLENLQALP